MPPSIAQCRFTLGAVSGIHVLHPASQVPEGASKGLSNIADALSSPSSSSSSDGCTPTHEDALGTALAGPRAFGSSASTSLLPALSPPARVRFSSLSHSRSAPGMSPERPAAQVTRQGQGAYVHDGKPGKQPGAKKHPGRGAMDMGLGSPVAKGRPPPPLQLSGLLDASETATAYAVAQKRVTTEYLHSPLVMHKVSEGVHRVLLREPKEIFPPHTHLCLGSDFLLPLVPAGWRSRWEDTGWSVSQKTECGCVRHSD